MSHITDRTYYYVLCNVVLIELPLETSEGRVDAVPESPDASQHSAQIPSFPWTAHHISVYGCTG